MTFKSTAVRGTLVAVAAGSALALSACGAGQISQTANQVAAVNGVAAENENITVRDASVVITPDNEIAVKATIGNVENNGATHTLQKVTVNGQNVTLNGTKDIKAGCSLHLDYQDAIDSYKDRGSDGTCNNFVATTVSGVSDIHPGGHAEVVFTLDNGDISSNASVVGFTPEAGKFHRNDAGLVDDSGEPAKDHSH